MVSSVVEEFKSHLLFGFLKGSLKFSIHWAVDFIVICKLLKPVSHLWMLSFLLFFMENLAYLHLDLKAQ